MVACFGVSLNQWLKVTHAPYLQMCSYIKFISNYEINDYLIVIYFQNGYSSLRYNNDYEIVRRFQFDDV